MKKKVILPLILLSSATICGAAVLNFNQGALLFNATDNSYIGNHYFELAETESNGGVKEYWASCESSHTKYYSTKEIPNYNKSDWQDKGVAVATTASEDRYIASPLASTFVKPGSEGFTTDGNTFVSSTTTDGWIMSTERYYNYSVDVTVDHRAVHNPWGDHKCTNAFILNGRSDNGRLYGYVLDFQSDFVQLSYLPNIAERAENHGGNVFFAQGGGTYTAHIDIVGDLFKLSINNEPVQTVQLNRHHYYEGETYLCENVYYESGSIGYLAYADDDGINHGRRLTISNFVKKDRHILADTTYNSGNDFTLSNQERTVATSTNSGWMMTNSSYTNFALKVRVNAGAHENIFGDHIAKNSILIGGGYSNGHLTGYVLEFQENHVEIAKLNGTEDYKTGDATVVIGYWTMSEGAFGVGGKDIFVKVVDGVLTVSSMDGAWRPSGKDEYPTGSYTLQNYQGGSLGYLFNDSTAHTVDVLQIAL